MENSDAEDNNATVKKTIVQELHKFLYNYIQLYINITI